MKRVTGYSSTQQPWTGNQKLVSGIQYRASSNQHSAKGEQCPFSKLSSNSSMPSMTGWQILLSYFLFFFFVLLLMEVVLRYFFNSPTVWANELAQMLFGAYAILAGGYILRTGGHVNVDILYSRLSRKSRAALDIVTSSAFFPVLRDASDLRRLAGLGLPVTFRTFPVGLESSPVPRQTDDSFGRLFCSCCRGSPNSFGIFSSYLTLTPMCPGRLRKERLYEY